MSAFDKSVEQAFVRNEALRFATEANRPDPGPTVRCSRCHAEIQSKFRHDFQSCTCGDVSIDGGGEPPPEAA